MRNVITRVVWPVDDYETDDGQTIYSYAAAPVTDGRLGALDWIRSAREKHDYFADAILLTVLAGTGYAVAVYGAGGAAAGSLGGESAVATVGVDTAVPAVAGSGAEVGFGQAVATVGVDTAPVGLDAFYAESMWAAQSVTPAATVAGASTAGAAAAVVSAPGGLTLGQIAGGASAALSAVGSVARDVAAVDASLARLNAPAAQSVRAPSGTVAAGAGSRVVPPAATAPAGQFGALAGLLAVAAGVFLL